jgi:hypothetical protein
VDNGVRVAGRDLLAKQLSAQDIIAAKAMIPQLRAQAPAVPAQAPRMQQLPESQRASAAMDTLGQQLASALHDNEKLRAALEQARQQQADLQDQLQAAQVVRDQLTEENQRLSTAQTAVDEVQDTNMRIRQLMSDNARLRADARRSSVELSLLYRQLRMNAQGSDTPTKSPAAAPAP